MSAELYRQIYRRIMDRQGEAVTVQHAPIPNNPDPPTQGPSRARIMEYQPYEIVGGITAGNRKAIFLHEDLAETPYPDGIVKGARIIWNGETLMVMLVDDATQRIGGVPVAYTCKVSGS